VANSPAARPRSRPRPAAPARPPIAPCAYGAGVGGLRGYLQPAVTAAASRYAAGLRADTVAQRTQARTTFAAAAAAYVYGLP
jgi:hypothetical protein